MYLTCDARIFTVRLETLHEYWAFWLTFSVSSPTEQYLIEHTSVTARKICIPATGDDINSIFPTAAPCHILAIFTVSTVIQ